MTTAFFDESVCISTHGEGSDGKSHQLQGMSDHFIHSAPQGIFRLLIVIIPFYITLL